MIEAVQKLVEDIRNRAKLMIGRAIINIVNDAGSIQQSQVQLLAEEVHDDVERIQEYGFTSNPKPGAEAVLVFNGGNRDHGLIIATDDRRYRVKGLASGEVAIYTDEGDTIILKRGNQIEFTTATLLIKATTKVSFDTPLIETTGLIEADLDIRDSRLIGGGKTMAGMRTIYNGHDHDENDSGGPTDEPNQLM